jgi:hypothetical protein
MSLPGNPENATASCRLRRRLATRKLGSTGAADEAAARDEVITRAETTLAASSARFEVRKQVTADPVTASAQDRHRHGPFKRLAGSAVKTAWDHMVPEQGRTRLRTAVSGMARGIIEPSARRFQHHQVHQDFGMLAHAMVTSRAEWDGTPNADVMTEDPLELLMRLRSVTAARYAGDETIREARCRKMTVTASRTTAGFTVWVDNEHVRQIQAVTPKTTERIVVTVLATTTVTAQLWDFGVPADPMDWPALPPRTDRVLPLIQRRRRIKLHAPPAAGPGCSWSRPAVATDVEHVRCPDAGQADQARSVRIEEPPADRGPVLGECWRSALISRVHYSPLFRRLGLLGLPRGWPAGPVARHRARLRGERQAL